MREASRFRIFQQQLANITFNVADIIILKLFCGEKRASEWPTIINRPFRYKINRYRNRILFTNYIAWLILIVLFPFFFLFVLSPPPCLFHPITTRKSMAFSIAVRLPRCAPANEEWRPTRRWAWCQSQRAGCCHSTTSITASALVRAPTTTSSTASLTTLMTTPSPCPPPTSATR